LNQRLQEQKAQLQHEAAEKQKYKDLYERYQSQLAHYQAREEEEHDSPVKTQSKPVRLQSAAANRPQTAAIKPQSAKPASNKKQVAKIDPKQLDEVFLELKLKLQMKGFYSNQIKDYFFKPYQSEGAVSIKKLRDMFEFNGFSDKKSELLARYLIEPRDG